MGIKTVIVCALSKNNFYLHLNMQTPELNRLLFIHPEHL
ncbi:hypothetical protein MuYL_0884 [Mucilaginibacter xinganensis]|uniref:Uncharacterized protein n=1 Tax=Mucilaginibacter xinganensis TaxID=1234841 RepID=A0A223NSX8_9SPHI|nr:hypothetical protein MuYL_0884 [Mucilaginibacter xinganensis]